MKKSIIRIISVILVFSVLFCITALCGDVNDGGTAYLLVCLDDAAVDGCALGESELDSAIAAIRNIGVSVTFLFNIDKITPDEDFAMALVKLKVGGYSFGQKVTSYESAALGLSYIKYITRSTSRLLLASYDKKYADEGFYLLSVDMKIRTASDLGNINLGIGDAIFIEYDLGAGTSDNFENIINTIDGKGMKLCMITEAGLGIG